MSNGPEPLTALTPSPVSLTHGLARNTFFNLIGWAWPALLSFASVPYILSGLGIDAFGVFGIISLVAGYLGLLSGPMAIGVVRFMAEAYGRQDWGEFRKITVLGLVVAGVLSGGGAALMFLAANAVAESLFKIPQALVANATIAFRLAAFSFFLNGLTSTLNGVPVALRRYDILNTINLIVGTFNTLGIILAIWLGWGLLGAVAAQVLSSLFSVVCFAVVDWLILRRFPVSHQPTSLDASLLKRLISFSSLLFLGSVASTIGLQIDRTLVGILMGTSAMTFYTIPTRITDQTPSFIARLTMALYPLSAESMGAGRMDELRRLYIDMVRLSLWVSALVATMIIISAHSILLLWVGPQIADSSWLVLVFLAASVIWRGPGGVAYQVSNGLGRGDFYMGLSVFAMVAISLPVVIFSTQLGLTGVALGVFVGLAIANVTYDLLTQRKLLGLYNWSTSLSPYFRVAIAASSTILCGVLFPLGVTSWAGLILRTAIFVPIFIGSSFVSGIIQKSDLAFLSRKLSNLRMRRTQ